jgi:gluconate 2-dehydrogenase gamma chain
VSQQDALLGRFQTGDIPLGRFDTTRFFEVLRTFALEGFPGDPRHGGNREGIAWTWLGITPVACR